jgi:hypothetical protein
MKDTKKKKTVNKRDIINDVMAKGFSTRKATKGVNAVFDAWQFALWCGEEVEVPGGILQVKATKGTEWATVQHFQNIATKEPMVRMVHTPGRRRVVKLIPDPGLGLMPDPPPPPPPSPPPPPPKPETVEEVEERQLVTDLLELAKPADDGTMMTIRQAVYTHPRDPGAKMSPKPGALLRRLREFKARGWKFHQVTELAQQVSEYHWL